VIRKTKNSIKNTIRANKTALKIATSIRKPAPMVSNDEVAEARAYIKHYWHKLLRHRKNNEDTLVGVPNPYLVAASESGHEFEFNELFYWDSYFMVQALLDEDHKDLVMGILDDLCYLFKKFKVIPNANRTFYMGRSQPPFLTSFIFDVYDAYQPGKRWLKTKINIAKDEYNTVWLGEKKPNVRLVHKGLSRYYDINAQHGLAEAESGWDLTNRFSNKCLDFLPVDLNCLLYKYESDFARAAAILGDKKEARYWRHKARERQEVVDRLMWDRLKGFYFDYNYKKARRGQVYSLAAYFALWSGLASEYHAKRLVRQLTRFEHRGGLSTTDSMPVNYLVPGAIPKQWAYPNGWAPLHFIAVKGLERYGYHEEAKRIVNRWLKCNLKEFSNNGVFYEKYNVVQPDKPPVRAVYASFELTGFGWTNAIFERFCQDYIDN
jgi:alpha,alpha-trehalase